MIRFDRLALIVILSVFLSAGLFAQGGDGRSDRVASRAVSSGDRYARRAPKPVRRYIPPKDPIEIIETGRLSIVVNEDGTRVFLTRIDSGREAELTSAVSNVPSLIVRTLPVGSYKLVVKKPGFFDETRTVVIQPEKRRKVVVNLRPQMAFLTVNTNLTDSEINVAGVGKFTGTVRKHFVKPGIYSISVQRRGYVSQTAVVDLRMPGREQNVSVVLQPLRIDSILSLATEKLFAGDLITAAALANDVLLLNPVHASANLLYGQIAYYRGDLSSSSFLLKAISNGETLSVPIKILEGTTTTNLVNVELRLNREGLSLKSKDRVDLNFTIARSDISEFRRSADTTSMPYLVAKGKSDFYGRPIEPSVVIYSRMASVRVDSPEVYCSGPASGRSCRTDHEILYKLITEWLSAKES